MRLLSNRHIKSLFCRELLLLLACVLLSAVIIGLGPEYAPLYVLACFLCTGLLMLAIPYRYFTEQSRVIDHAAAQIRKYLSGNPQARIDCEEEGELYRLFHEVNSLATILNAHAEQEKRANLFLKDTLSDISHQLKTPLAALHVYNGIIQEEAGESPAVQEFAALSEQELDRITVLVQNLLKIARFDAGTTVMEKNMEQVSDMMRCIEQHFSYRVKQEHKSLTLSGDDKVSFWCDRGWLIEAVSNLVKNAFDNTGSGTDIRLEWKHFASTVQITVTDNGTGIPPEDFPHIFKRFYRSRFSKDTQGIGLGLPLAKSIIEAHDGTIEVDSDPGIGTAFTIHLPIPTKL
ncbi:MAG: HAMP domain-containing histidine kinase [Hungatella hathewayi]|nr:HAMP domain-containing histidine kinase [Hungatella hathewayi]